MESNIKKKFKLAYRHVLEEKVTPIILDIEQQAEDQHQVSQANEDDHHHAAVHREPLPSHVHLAGCGIGYKMS